MQPFTKNCEQNVLIYNSHINSDKYKSHENFLHAGYDFQQKFWLKCFSKLNSHHGRLISG